MSAPLLDRAVIDDLFDFIGVKAVRPVIELFLNESRALVGRIEQSAANDPAGRETIRRAAHSLKSGAGQVGAAALSEAAAVVERAAEHAATDLLATIASLRARAAETQGAFASLLQSK
jgi:HPt (histidine-containing phosphotransfer) domain-containing protein